VKDDAGNDLRSNGQESYFSALATLCFAALLLLEGNYNADLNGIAKVLWYVFIFPDAGYDAVKGLMALLDMLPCRFQLGSSSFRKPFLCLTG